MKKTPKDRRASRERIVILSVLFAVSLVLAISHEADRLIRGDEVEVVQQEDDFYSTCKKTFLSTEDLGDITAAWIRLDGCSWSKGPTTDTFDLRKVRKVSK